MFSKRRKNRKFKATRSVIALLAMILVVAFIGHKTKVAEIADIKVEAYEEQSQTKDQKLEQLVRENEQLRLKLESSAKIETSDTTRALAMEYIKKYFPEPQVQAQVMKIVKCESNFNNMAYNKNNNGSIDKGIFQINSIHSAKFKEVTGFDYQTGANDFSANTKYARYIYDTQGNFSAWVCSRLI